MPDKLPPSHMDGVTDLPGVNCPGCGSPRLKDATDVKGVRAALWCPDCGEGCTEAEARKGQWSNPVDIA